MKDKTEYRVDAGEIGLYCYSTEEGAMEGFRKLTEIHPNLPLTLIKLTPTVLKTHSIIKTFECTRCTPKCSLTVDPKGMACSTPQTCPYDFNDLSTWKEVENEK